MVVCKSWEHSIVAKHTPDVYKALDFTHCTENWKCRIKIVWCVSFFKQQPALQFSNTKWVSCNLVCSEWECQGGSRVPRAMVQFHKMGHIPGASQKHESPGYSHFWLFDYKLGVPPRTLMFNYAITIHKTQNSTILMAISLSKCYNSGRAEWSNLWGNICIA